MMSHSVETPSGCPKAYLEAMTHVHHYQPFNDGIERCSCGALRAAYPDER